MSDKSWTTKDVCEYAGVSVGTVFSWRKSGMPFLDLCQGTSYSHAYRYNPAEVKAWITDSFRGGA